MEVALKDIRPPTPQMRDSELHQWRQRIYAALVELSNALEIEGGDLVTDHDDLENNGGTGSHDAISTHIASSIAHGSGSKVAGQSYVLEKIAEAISAISGLQHGVEVDNPTSGVHGVTGDLVGSTDAQTLTNKSIDGDSNTIINLKHGEEVDNPTAAHGVGEVVGTTEEQTLTNKSIIPRIKIMIEDIFYLTDDYDLVLVYSEESVITLASAASRQGSVVNIVNTSPGEFSILPQPLEYISGETSQRIPRYCSIALVSTGIDWRII